MKKLYVLASSVMNGTVTMRTDHGVEIWNQIEEAVAYENAEEVPILNVYKDGDE